MSLSFCSRLGALFICIAGWLPGAYSQNDPLSLATQGEILFARQWIADIPNHSSEFDGLGPLFNARSCLECHTDARGGRALTDAVAPGVMLALTSHSQAQFGTHIQDRATLFHDPEIEWRNDWPYAKRQGLALSAADFGRRVAPSLLTTALILQVADTTILQNADPQDVNGDGIRGQVARLAQSPGAPILPGRFGWKAQHATLESQVLEAFAVDLGVTRDELALEHLPQILAYLQTLRPVTWRAPPSSFSTLGCSACHRANGGLYSDLLLHDMGAGLAEGATPYGLLWRTAPLADLRQAFEVGAFLHDGRAATVTQAVMAHGGTGAKARAAWQAASPEERREIVHWLRALAGIPVEND